MSRRAEAVAIFGAPNGEYEKEAVWNPDASQLEKAVAFECSGPKPEEGRLDPSSVHFAYRFSWRDPWPSCAESALSQSTLGVYISGAKLFFQPNFVFVAPINSPEFREQFLSVEAAAPFKFSDANFKRWVIDTKRRNMGRHLNVDRNWRKSWSIS